MDNPAQMTDMEVRERVIKLEEFREYYAKLVLEHGYDSITSMLANDTKKNEHIAELEAMLAYWKRTTHVEMKREVEPSLQVLNRGRVRDEGWMRKLRWR